MNQEVANWLTRFEAEPVAELHALVLGRTAVPAWTRSSLREIFIEIWQTKREVLDKAIVDWLSPRIFQPPPERTPEEVWASHLQDVFRAVAGVPMPKVERLLRDGLRDFRSWLRPFRYSESCDPEAAFLAALAWASTNQGLAGLWQTLALRKNHEPIYYTDIGLLGLCKMRDDHGEMPAKAPFLLLATLVNLADASMPREDWELTTRALLASYHWSEATWVREFNPVLEARPNAQNGPKWLKRILPSLVAKQNEEQPHHPTPAPQPPHTFEEIRDMVREVKKAGPARCGAPLTNLLSRLRAYASATNNPYYLVRSFNTLAEAAREHDAAWAVARAEEALAWDEGNARNWTVLARCLWARGVEALKTHRADDAEADAREALDTLWTARFRFPYDAFVRTELARLHREAGDFPTAESVYLEAIAEFPRDAACRNGLAEALEEEGKVAEAKKVYRQAVQDVPNDIVTLMGFSKFLFDRSAQGQNASEREEARTLLVRAAHLGYGYAQKILNTFDERWQRLAGQLAPQAQQFAVDVASPNPDEMRPVQRLGRALLLQWQAERESDQNKRENLFARAEQLLALPIAAAGECRWAFIEARGFLFLARNRVPEARAYFEAQLTEASPRRPLGLRLGLIEARARLGEPLTDNEDVELQSFGALGSIAPLVLKVVRLLEVNESDAALRETLLSLYPLVQELLGIPMSEIGEDVFEEDQPQQVAPKQETPNKMLAQWLSANVFIPAGVHVREDLQSAEVLTKARTAARSARVDVLSGIEKLALVA